MNRHIMIVDDEESIRTTLGGVLEDEGYRVTGAKDGAEAQAMVGEQLPDLVLLDIWMPGKDGIDVLRDLKEAHPHLPVIMISGHGNIETAVRATKLGAQDFIEKPLSLEKVVHSVQTALEYARVEAENRLLRAGIEAKYEMIGKSGAFNMLVEQIGIAAPTDSWVLVTGENGTGKELVARQIHMKSRRKNRPFIEVNCAAIPDELIESELFGHEKGSFTGATQKKRGRFDMADGGTIFLDEIADMSLKTQAKVLRILQEQTFVRVGGTEAIEVDVRVIAATNKDLEEEIRAERFREDLYFRLNVIPLHVPPLRERREDIALFVDFFGHQFAARSGLPNKAFTKTAIEALAAYEWPGNVRELKNIVERLVIMTREREVTEGDVRRALKFQVRPSGLDLFTISDLREAKGEFEREFILRKLNENDWNVSRTAEAIGLERSNLYRKIRAHDLEEQRSGEKSV
jgi:two-component system, NtrC family, nitrogen regulation response regulator NtrX